MFELPLFPLNSVLFPGMPLELYIFEDRYKQMIGMCIEKRQPFGVVLIRRGRAEYGLLAEPFRVGCTAQITQVQPLGQGRMNIVAVGHERFQVVSLNREKPYLTGSVEPYPIEDPLGTEKLAQKLRALLERFLRLMDQAGQIRFKSQQLPKDPVALAYLASVLLQIPPVQQKAQLFTLITSDQSPPPHLSHLRTFIAQQQALLETQQASRLLHNLCRIYSRETALLRAMMKETDINEGNEPFTLN